MTTLHAAHGVHGHPPIDTDIAASGQLTRTLGVEADELEAMHAGLRRHVDAWRAAHASTVDRLTAVLARMDSIMERIERKQA